MNFRFLNKSDPSDYVTELANGMHVFSKAHTVAGSHLHFAEDLAEVQVYLESLTPSNSFILVTDKAFAGSTTLKEKWYVPIKPTYIY
jgi:secreted Zn-dependent insulinase-like peptidase